MAARETHVVGLGQAFAALGLMVGAAVVLVGLVLGLDRTGLVRFDLVSVALLVVGGLGLAFLAIVRWWLLGAHGWSWSVLGFRRPGARLLHALWQVPVVLVGAAAVQGVFTALVLGGPDAASAGSDPIEDAVAAGPPWAVVLLALAVCVVTPLWEEALFRGALWSGFARRLPAPLAILATGALFAAVHGIPAALPYLLVLGTGLTWLRWFHRDVWASVALHAVNNTIVTLGALLLV